MLTNECILEDIKAAMELNKNSKAICNDALTHAMTLIMNNEKELQNRINEEYERGMNDTWDLARKICKFSHDELANIFGDYSVENAITKFTSIEANEKILSYEEEKENDGNKVYVGDVVQCKNDGTKATILDYDSDDNLENNFWIVFTEIGCVEKWCENNFTQTGEHVDIHSVLIK